MNTHCKKKFTNSGKDPFFRDHYICTVYDFGTKIEKSETESKQRLQEKRHKIWGKLYCPQIFSIGTPVEKSKLRDCKRFGKRGKPGERRKETNKTAL